MITEPSRGVGRVILFNKAMITGLEGHSHVAGGWGGLGTPFWTLTACRPWRPLQPPASKRAAAALLVRCEEAYVTKFSAFATKRIVVCIHEWWLFSIKTSENAEKKKKINPCSYHLQSKSLKTFDYIFSTHIYIIYTYFFLFMGVIVHIADDWAILCCFINCFFFNSKNVVNIFPVRDKLLCHHF